MFAAVHQDLHNPFALKFQRLYVVQNGTNRGSERLMKCSNCLPAWSHAGGSEAKTASMLPHCA